MTTDLRTCCAALLHAPLGYFRPRKPDERFLRSLVDAGLPRAHRTVDIRVLPQVPKPVPTAGVAEGVRSPRRIDIALTAFVVDHPKARFIVDPGVCGDVRQRVVSELPSALRPAVGPPADVISSAVALGGATVDFALPTHLHWDHVCGVLDLPSLPLRLNRVELDWVTSDSVAPVGGVRSSLVDRPISTYELDGPAVATFARSHDLFGDGSVVLVDLAGHTPGSIGVLAATPTGPVLLAGDAAWHGVQIAQLRQRPSYPGMLVDEDRDAAFRTLHRLHAVRDRMSIVATHDYAAAAALSH
jgi:glyoxylase-like metal-dependent hydrolase (beta-lactamase superfamily II)